MNPLDFIREAGETRRFHTMPVLRQQNIAEHSWHATMLLWYIYGGQEPGVSLELMMACMTHDAAEFLVGDLPAPAKREMDKRLDLKGAETFKSAWDKMEQDLLQEVGLDWKKFLSEEQVRQLTLVDCLDGMFYCVRERAMGNRLIEPAFQNYKNYIYSMLGDDPGLPHDKEGATAADIEWQVFNHALNLWSQFDD